MGCVIPPSTALAEGELVSDRPAAWGSRKALPGCPSRAIPAPLGLDSRGSVGQELREGGRPGSVCLRGALGSTEQCREGRGLKS